MTELILRLCKNCCHWKLHKESSCWIDGTGECRINPPLKQSQTLWPTTHNDDWCGKFEAARDNV